MNGRVMNFTLKSVQNGCRLGTVVAQDVCVETPACMLYTRKGSAPHLSDDALKRMKNVPEIVHVSANHFIQSVDILEQFGQDLKTWACQKGRLVYVSLHDPAEEVRSGYNEKNFVSMWARGGRMKVNETLLTQLYEALQPDMCQALVDCDTQPDASKKRVRKSYDTSKVFLDTCIQRHQKSEVLQDCRLLGTAGGGHVIKERIRWSQELAKRPVAGHIIDGFSSGGPKTESISFPDLVPLIEASLGPLREDLPRIMHWMWSPDHVMEAVEAGIDLFDSSFVYVVSLRGGVLNFSYKLGETSKNVQNSTHGEEQLNAQTRDLEINGEASEEGAETSRKGAEETPSNGPKRHFELNVMDKRYWHDNDVPLVPGCTCYTCTTHRRSYVSYLRRINELFAYEMLMIHNLHHYCEFFAAVRKSLNDGTFQQLKELIMSHKRQ